MEPPQARARPEDHPPPLYRLVALYTLDPDSPAALIAERVEGAARQSSSPMKRAPK